MNAVTPGIGHNSGVPYSSVPRVRAATPADLERVLELLRCLHAETPHAALDEERLREGVLEVLQEGVIILSVDAAGVPVGTLGLAVDSPWFSKEPWLCDRWMFVHPVARRTPHARTLIRAAMRLAREQGLPLQMAVTGYGPRIPGKIRLFARELGEPIGAIWNLKG